MTKRFQTRLFKSGDSVAVRLPKRFGIPEGVDVEIAKDGDVVTIRVCDNEPASESHSRG